MVGWYWGCLPVVPWAVTCRATATRVTASRRRRPPLIATPESPRPNLLVLPCSCPDGVGLRATGRGRANHGRSNLCVVGRVATAVPGQVGNGCRHLRMGRIGPVGPRRSRGGAGGDFRDFLIGRRPMPRGGLLQALYRRP